MWITRRKAHTVTYMIEVSPKLAADKELSAKARGMYLWLLYAKKTGVTITQQKAREAGLGGFAAIRSGFEELEERGYLIRNISTTEEGYHVSTEYVLNEHPHG